jgi:sulfur-carrier protein
VRIFQRGSGMRIILKCYADYRETIGIKEMLLDLRDGQTIEGLLRMITNKYPALKQKLFVDNYELKDLVTVLVNGRNIEFLERMNTRLREGDLISLFPPVAGG